MTEAADALGSARCRKGSCGQVIERIDGTVSARGGHTFYAAPCGHEQDRRTAQEAFERGVPPVYFEAVTGIALMAAERKRQRTEEGASDEHDAAHEASELAWASWCYLDRATAETDEKAYDPEPPAMWPWEPESWKPGPTRVRMIVKAGALAAAEVDRRLKTGEQP